MTLVEFKVEINPAMSFNVLLSWCVRFLKLRIKHLLSECDKKWILVSKAIYGILQRVLIYSNKVKIFIQSRRRMALWYYPSLAINTKFIKHNGQCYIKWFGLRTPMTTLFKWTRASCLLKVHVTNFVKKLRLDEIVVYMYIYSLFYYKII